MFQKPKGTRDLINQDSFAFQEILRIFQETTKLNNYEFVETPIYESYDLFARGMGDTTDVVNKEMIDFYDKSNRHLALRPEGTAGIIRSLIESKIIFNPALNQKYYYYGPMFRYERPQKGRYRQFYQIGLENFNANNYYNDYLVIKIAHDFLKKLKIKNIQLQINSLGSNEDRNNYLKILRDYFNQYKDNFDEISLKRLEKNPLRIFDDKTINQLDFIKKAPKLYNYLSQETKDRFTNLINLLKRNNIDLVVKHDLVRGFDYYTDVVFEFVPLDEEHRAQSTILGGGRYSNLVKELDGPELSGIGFAAGLDRLMILLEEQNILLKKEFKIYLFNNDKNEIESNLTILDKLVQNNFICDTNLDNFKYKKNWEIVNSQGYDVLLYFDTKEQKYYVKLLNNQKILIDIDNLINDINKIKDELIKQ